MNPAISDRLLRYSVIGCQVLLSLTFIFSGIAKCIDPTGTAIKIGEYFGFFGLSFLAGWTMPLSWLLCLTETMIGIHLLLGRSKLAVWCAGLIMMVFTPLTLYLALTDPIEDCGCFGDVLVLSNWETFYKNIVLSLAVAVVWFNYSRCWQPLKPFLSACYTYGFFAVALILCYIGTWHLPYIDFRPYKPGTLLSVTRGNTESQFIIVYEKDGERKEFPLDAIPDPEDGWEFVETIELKPEVSEEAHSAESFFLTDASYEDVTQEICGHEGYTFLLMSPSLANASERYLDRIESIYEYCRQQDYPFYLITLRDSTMIDQWFFRTGAEYSTLFSDASVISTVIRANPGIVLLKDGAIQWKSCLSDLDISVLTSAKLSEQTYGKTHEIDYQKRILSLIALLFGPFFVILLLQIAITYINLRKNEKENRSR